jgi:hypothetical protein
MWDMRPHPDRTAIPRWVIALAAALGLLVLGFFVLHAAGLGLTPMHHA